jgi:hypothetical protein
MGLQSRVKGNKQQKSFSPKDFLERSMGQGVQCRNDGLTELMKSRSERTEAGVAGMWEDEYWRENEAQKSAGGPFESKAEC